MRVQAGECLVKVRWDVPFHSCVWAVKKKKKSLDPLVEIEKAKSLGPNPEGPNIYGSSVGERSHKDGLRGGGKSRVCGTPGGKGS